jgi:hypothetical protein
MSQSVGIGPVLEFVGSLRGPFTSRPKVPIPHVNVARPQNLGAYISGGAWDFSCYDHFTHNGFQIHSP